MLEYLLWAVAALLLGVGYMHLILGSAPEQTSSLSFLIAKIYFLALLYVGGIVGAILAVFFILFDVFYLKRKWQSSTHFFTIRAASMLFILMVVATLHYLLEKTFDVI
ncbi:hypothetical protein [Bowmanella yangjiangensis]|uniref:Uncharacterized protein n=1 Tax=Bowmanella yangjiangensis TaxID=2811230 RepID=A0ABS3CNU8_9ALTE|nr:hypothetical protein [Bowmanella yangjiangensis]MBN7818747.1 hypothetical protein [Bowmanella yangjiangensis]